MEYNIIPLFSVVFTDLKNRTFIIVPIDITRCSKTSEKKRNDKLDFLSFFTRTLESRKLLAVLFPSSFAVLTRFSLTHKDQFKHGLFNFSLFFQRLDCR